MGGTLRQTCNHCFADDVHAVDWCTLAAYVRSDLGQPPPCNAADSCISATGLDQLSCRPRLHQVSLWTSGVSAQFCCTGGYEDEGNEDFLSRDIEGDNLEEQEEDPGQFWQPNLPGNTLGSINVRRFLQPYVDMGATEIILTSDMLHGISDLYCRSLLV